MSLMPYIVITAERHKKKKFVQVIYFNGDLIMFIAFIIGYHASLGTKYCKLNEMGINYYVICKRNCQFIS